MRSIGFLVLLIAAVLFYSCEDNVEKEVAQPQVNRLEARAGSDKQALVDDVVVLDGGASRDGNGKPFVFNWILKAKPSGSNAVLINDTSPSATLKVDKAGKYVIELKVSQDTFSDTDEVVIHVTKEEPVNLPEYLSEDINESRKLKDIYDDPEKPDYLVTDFIRVNATLQIEPGVVIAFERDQAFSIDRGELIAIGTAESKITFTGVEKTPGFWRGIVFFSNSLSNEMDHVVIECGGSGAFFETLSSERANIFLAGSNISGAALKIKNSQIAFSGGYGLYVRGMSYLTGFESNDFYDNAGTAVYLPAGVVRSMDEFSTFEENGFDGVETGGSLEQGASPSRWTALADGKPYLITSDLVVASGLVIGEGSILKFKSNVGMTVTATGYLSALGTETDPVTLTALVNYGTHNWKGLLIESINDNNLLGYTEISYAGHSGFTQLGNLKANIGVIGSAVVQNSDIHHGNGWGIVATDGLLNENAETVNRFSHLPLGNVKMRIVYEPVDLTGHWMDWWSVTNDRHEVSVNLFDRATGTWFGGAYDPWSMTSAGFGLKISSDGTYVWTIAMHSPMTGCESYSAEHFTGQIQNHPNELTFVEASWRSKFYFSCDESQNVDMDVQPGQMTVAFETLQETHAGKKYDVLKLYSGGESFKYYRLRQ